MLFNLIVKDNINRKKENILYFYINNIYYNQSILYELDNTAIINVIMLKFTINNEKRILCIRCLDQSLK